MAKKLDGVLIPKRRNRVEVYSKFLDGGVWYLSEADANEYGARTVISLVSSIRHPAKLKGMTVRSKKDGEGYRIQAVPFDAEAGEVGK